jgi:hypothetical protein
MTRTQIVTALLCAGSIVGLGFASIGQTPRQESKPTVYTYAKDIAPLTKSYCRPCHDSENENPSGLSMDDYERLMKGGNHGSTVVPGKPKESNLYLKLLPTPPFGKQMARGKKKLSAEDVKIIYEWIEQGAKKE